MKQTPRQSLTYILAFSTLSTGGLALAGTTMTTDTKDISAPPPPSTPFVYSQEFSTDVGYTGHTVMKQGSATVGNVGDLDAHFHYVFAPQLNENLIFRFGGESSLDAFSTTPGLPIPNTLQAYNLVLGADFTASDKIIIRAEAHPGLYGDNHLSFDAFDCPVQIGGTYLYSKDLQFIFGVQVDLNSKYPVVGLPGIRWQINDNWVLSAIPPKPQIQYLFSKDLTLYFGADLTGSTYRVSKNFGDNHGHGAGKNTQSLDSAWMDYTEVRVGPGVSYKIVKGLSLDFSAGVVPYRDYTYDRAHLTLHNKDVAPYAQLGLTGTF